MVLLDTGTPGTSKESFSEDADDGTLDFSDEKEFAQMSIGLQTLDGIHKLRMRSQPQLINDKIIMMQYTNWINSTPSQQ